MLVKARPTATRLMRASAIVSTLRLPPAELACEGNDLGLRLAERFPSFAPPFLLALANRSEFRNRARLLKLRDDTQHLANQNSCRCVLGEKVGGLCRDDRYAE